MSGPRTGSDRCPICAVWDAADVDWQDPAGATPPRDPASAAATFEFIDSVGGRWHYGYDIEDDPATP